MSVYKCMICLLGDMWEMSGTVCKQARSATVSAQLSSKSSLIKLIGVINPIDTGAVSTLPPTTFSKTTKLTIA